MTDLVEQIKQDLIAAQKSKDELRISVLRYILSRFTYAQIEKQRELTDEDIIEEIAKEAKRHRESIEAFEKGGRAELAQKEQAELDILQSYLPEQLSEDELIKLVDQAISQTGASTKQDMGKVIGMVMGQVKGRAEGGVVSRLVAQKLQ